MSARRRVESRFSLTNALLLIIFCNQCFTTLFFVHCAGVEGQSAQSVCHDRETWSCAGDGQLLLQVGGGVADARDFASHADAGEEEDSDSENHTWRGILRHHTAVGSTGQFSVLLVLSLAVLLVVIATVVFVARVSATTPRWNDAKEHLHDAQNRGMSKSSGYESPQSPLPRRITTRGPSGPFGNFKPAPQPEGSPVRSPRRSATRSSNTPLGSGHLDRVTVSSRPSVPSDDPDPLTDEDSDGGDSPGGYSGYGEDVLPTLNQLEYAPGRSRAASAAQGHAQNRAASAMQANPADGRVSIYPSPRPLPLYDNSVSAPSGLPPAAPGSLPIPGIRGNQSPLKGSQSSIPGSAQGSQSSIRSAQLPHSVQGSQSSVRSAPLTYSTASSASLSHTRGSV